MAGARPAFEFVHVLDSPRRRGLAEIRTQVPESAVEGLTTLLEGGLPGPTLLRFLSGGVDVGWERRLVGTVADWFAAGNDQLPGVFWSATLAGWCEEAGVPYQTLHVTGEGEARQAKRWHPLQRVRTAGGHLRTLALELSPDTKAYRYGVRFCERYEPDQAAHPDDKWEHLVGADHSALATLATRFGIGQTDEGAERGTDDLADRLIAGLATSIAQGQLGGAGPPRRDRDQVAAWWAEAGVEYTLGGTDRKRTLATFGPPTLDHVCALELTIHANGTRPTVTFIEWRRSAKDRTGDPYQVQAPLAALPALAAYLSDRVGGVPERPGTGEPDEERLFAACEALVAAGELGPELPRRRIRDRVAEWFTAAGAEVTVYGHDRTERLHHAYRKPTGCNFTLRLVLDPGRDEISFLEDYEYLPRDGDPGREYGYSVTTPYRSLRALVSFFQERTGTAAVAGQDPEEALIAGFAALVAAGELADGLPLKANRDRVAAWFTEAGVPAESSGSAWFNSDD